MLLSCVCDVIVTEKFSGVIGLDWIELCWIVNHIQDVIDWYSVIQLVMVKRLKPTILQPSSSAECKVMPLILNAATPVGAVSNTAISSGSILPESLRSLRVSECTNLMGFSNTTGTTKEYTIRFYRCPCFNAVTAMVVHDYVSLQLPQKSPVLIPRDFLFVGGTFRSHT